MTDYYHADPAKTKGDNSGRYPANHVNFPLFLAPINWVNHAKQRLSGSDVFLLGGSLLKEFDKPGQNGPLHPRWGSSSEIAAIRNAVEVFSHNIDNNPGLSPIGRLLLKTLMSAHLKNRTEMIAFYDENADFIEANGKYVAPIIVTGFPRTGTTLLHRLLAEDPNARSPFTFEMEKALPPLESGDDPFKDPRIKKSNATMGTMTKLAPGFVEKFAESHLWSATEKEESVPYMQLHNGMNFLNNYQAGLEYMLRIAAPDIAPALFKYERNYFTMLDAYAPAPSHWINKSPGYAHYFGAIFDEFPEARVVVTHRNPAKNIASMARLMESWCIAFDKDGAFDKHEFGRLTREYWGITLENPLAFRKANPGRESQIIDAVYSETFADPIGMVKRIYEKFEMEVSTEFEERMKAYTAENQQGKYGRHRYCNEEYGLDGGAIKARYFEYFAKYGYDATPKESD